MSALIAWGAKEEESTWAWKTGILAGVSFFVGAITSIVSGYIGMKVAVFGNARCTVGACSPTIGWTESFNTAFRAGGVMGFSLTGIALLSLYILMCILKCVRRRDARATAARATAAGATTAPRKKRRVAASLARAWMRVP